jgi:hypothetical protein
MALLQRVGAMKTKQFHTGNVHMDETTTTPATNNFGQIMVTQDYSKFKYMGGNRNVDLKHVRELQTQMERNPDLFKVLPILVNADWYIVDGQHRFEAAKALGMPVYYVQQKDMGLADARQLNIAQKRWTLTDFARSYADSGRRDYVELLRYKAKYPKLPLSIIVAYMAGAGQLGGDASNKFRRGEYTFRDAPDGESALDVLDSMRNILHRPVHYALAAALWTALHHEDFNEQKFLTKLGENPDALTITNSVRGNLRGIEDVFNRHNKVPIRLY